jgi:hypothetical protein
MKKLLIPIIGLAFVAGVIHAALNPIVTTNYTTNVTSRVVVTNNTEQWVAANEQVILQQLRAITNKSGGPAFRNSATKNGRLILEFSTNTINATFVPRK